MWQTNNQIKFKDKRNSFVQKSIRINKHVEQRRKRDVNPNNFFANSFDFLTHRFNHPTKAQWTAERKMWNYWHSNHNWIKIKENDVAKSENRTVRNWNTSDQVRDKSDANRKTQITKKIDPLASTTTTRRRRINSNLHQRQRNNTRKRNKYARITDISAKWNDKVRMSNIEKPSSCYKRFMMKSTNWEYRPT